MMERGREGGGMEMLLPMICTCFCLLYLMAQQLFVYKLILLTCIYTQSIYFSEHMENMFHKQILV